MVGSRMFLGFPDDFSDISAVIIGHTFFCNGHIHTKLRLQYRFYIFYIYGIDKLPDMLHIQKTPVRQVILLFSRYRDIFKDLSVFLNSYNISMVISNSHLCRICACMNGYFNIKSNTAFQMFHCNRGLFQELFDFLNLFLFHIGDYFQFLFRIPCHNSCRRCRRNAFQMSGMRHDHRFYIFDNTSAGCHFYFIRQYSQCLSRYCRRIGQCNRLGTSHCRYQFFF